MPQFLVVFEFVDEAIFHVINNLKNNLDIAFKGKYKLKIVFNSKNSSYVERYNLLGAPALINLQTNQIIYGNFTNKDFLKKIYEI